VTMRTISRATAAPGLRSNPTPMLRASALIIYVIVASACTAPAQEVRPPEDQIFWPTGLEISPDESKLFVANANSDLKYDSGSVDMIDLDAVEAALGPWAVADPKARVLAAGCTQDTDFSETMVCDEAPFIKTSAGVRVGNFATSIGVQQKNAGGDLRLVVPVRGDPSITWIDDDAATQTLACAPATDGGYALCDDAHRITYIRGDSTVGAIADEPFDVFVDSGDKYAVVSHLTSGTVTLVDLPTDASPQATDEITGLFGADPLTGAIGATGVAGRAPGTPDDLVYVGAHTEDRIQTMTIVRPRDGSPALLNLADFFFLNTVGAQSGGSSDTRGIAFGSGGDRMYVVNRMPPTVQVYDTSIGPTGEAQKLGLGATDICRQASRLVLADAGDGERVYVSCFDDGQVYVVDPRGGISVADVISVGHGPYDVVASPSKHRLYVSNYLDDTISVVDITPGAATRDRVVMRLGEPRQQ
jgi:DNA-binding beta-propeller fold protein YncE